MNALLKSTVAGGVISKQFVGGQTMTLVRNAGGHGPSLRPGTGGIPFPPGPRQMAQIRNWYNFLQTVTALAS